MALIMNNMGGGERTSVYKAFSHNINSGSANLYYGILLSPEDVEGFTEIAVSSDTTGVGYEYKADGGSDTSFTSPLTIPPFTTSLRIQCTASVVAHGDSNSTFTLS